MAITKKTKTAKKTVAKAPKAKTAKKTTKKTAAKKATAKKTTEKKAPAKKATEKKGGLRKPQLRILAALLKKPNLTRAQIAENAPCDSACCTELIGSLNADIRVKNDKKWFPSLISLGLVKAEQHDVDGKDVIQFSLSAGGKKAARSVK